MRCVPAHYFTVLKALRWRSSIDASPPYQRHGCAWSLPARQLFIDSLLNGYDVPKIYLHDLRGTHPTKAYSIVDGKQRLTAIWGFLDDAFPLARDFRVESANMPDLPEDAQAPEAGARFSAFDRHWRAALLDTFLSVVLIQRATEADIEDLFARLNSGEPLSAAERRNAVGGEVAALIREVVEHPFFTDRVRFANDRLQHHEVAARLLLIEAEATDRLPDLRAARVDEFVRTGRRLRPGQGRALAARVARTLSSLGAIFGTADPLLARPAAAVLYYALLRHRARARAETPTARGLRTAIARVQAAPAALDRLPGGDHEASLVELSRLQRRGAMSARDLERQLEILDAALAPSR